MKCMKLKEDNQNETLPSISRHRFRRVIGPLLNPRQALLESDRVVHNLEIKSSLIHMRLRQRSLIPCYLVRKALQQQWTPYNNNVNPLIESYSAHQRKEENGRMRKPDLQQRPNHRNRVAP